MVPIWCFYLDVGISEKGFNVTQHSGFTTSTATGSDARSRRTPMATAHSQTTKPAHLTSTVSRLPKVTEDRIMRAVPGSTLKGDRPPGFMQKRIFEHKTKVDASSENRMPPQAKEKAPVMKTETERQRLQKVRKHIILDKF